MKEKIEKHNNYGHIPLYNYLYEEDKNVELISPKIVPFIGTNKIILDAGCGKGNHSLQMKEMNNTVYGMEISKFGVEKTRAAGISCEQVDFNVDKFPFEDNFFDIVLSYDIVEHIINGENYFNECYRVLKKNGSLLIFTPNFHCLSNIKQTFQQLIGAWDWYEMDIRHYGPLILKKRVERSGFEVDLFPKKCRLASTSSTLKGKIATLLLPKFIYGLLSPSIFIEAYKK